MADYIIPSGAAGGNTAGAINWKSSVADYASLPGSGNSSGDARITLDTSDIWIWNGSAWVSSTAGAIALTNAHILVGNASNVATDVAMSGDVTISNTGVTTIGASKVTEAMQVLADNTTNDVSTTKHGYAPKAPNDATKYLDGTGAWTVPAGGGGGSIGTPIEATPNASPVALSTTPALITSISIPAPAGTSDVYLVWFGAQDDISGVTATGGTRSSGYYLDDGSPLFATAVVGLQVPALAAAVDGVNAMYVTSPACVVTVTGGVTLSLYGSLNSSVTGTWNCGVNSGKITAVKIIENP